MTSLKNKIVVLVSDAGTGTNLQAIIDGVKSGQINAEISAVISNKPDTLALNRAKENNLHIEICPIKERLLPLLQKINPDYICLAGWMQIIQDEVIDAYPNRILNLHPGIIPDSLDESTPSVKAPDGSIVIWNKGVATDRAVQNFLDEKNTYAGSSIHFLTHVFDFGQVLGRVFEKIEPNDTSESLYVRLKKKENEMYVEVLNKLCSNEQ